MDEAIAELSPLLTMATPWAYALGLALARVGGLMLALPQMMGNKAPAMVKATIAVAVAVAVVFVGPLPLEILTRPRPELSLVFAAAGEFCFGLALGFFLHVGLAAIRFAGEVCGVEMGFSFAAVADPMSNEQSTPVSQLFSQLSIQLFLVLGFDRWTIRVLADSVKGRPLGEAYLDAATAAELTSLGDGMIRTGVQLALPIMGTVFALKLAMAMLARIAPQLQIFSLAFTLTILLGMLALSSAYPAIGAEVAEHLESVVTELERFATHEPNG